MHRFALLVLAALATGAQAGDAPPARFRPGPERIAVAATPVALDPAHPRRHRLGALRWRGGLVLRSRDVRFGGLSALRWDGRALMSVSDEGNMFAFRPVERGGRLIGVADVRVRRLAGPDGTPLTTKATSDFEALEVLPDPDCDSSACPMTHATLALETSSSLWTYRIVDGLPGGAPVAMTAAAAWRARQSRTNGGVEAMAGSHTIWLMVSEELRDAAGRASAYLLHNGGAGDAPPDRGREIGIAVGDGFKPTDLALLREAPATFLLLQRWYAKGAPNATRLGRFTLRTAPDGSVTAGPVETLATLRAPLTVDNFEGLAIRRVGARTFLYMISDDNFSKTQRTLLMKWELVG